MEVLDAFLQEFQAIAFWFALVFIAADVVTGYAQAIANRDIQSSKMRKGFWHKLALIFVLLLAGGVDVLLEFESGQVDIGITAPIFEAACVYVIVMELTSILENIKKLNPELADTKLLRLFNTTSETEEDDGARQPRHAAAEDGGER